MANELRVRSNFMDGLVEDNPLLIGATTLTSAALQFIPVIGSTQHYAIVLDPDGIAGAPEIAYITAHTALATTATISRGLEGSTARAHLRDTPWEHGPLASDFPTSVIYTVPSSTSYTGTTLGSLATPILVTVPVLAGQVVDLEGMFNGYCSGDNVIYWALRRNPSTVLCKGAWYTASTGTRPNSMTGRWTDTAPGSGNISYEMLVASSGGTVNLTTGDGSTTISLTGSSGGGNQLKATPRWS